ncbi:acetylserotonin O-methyltransferase-like [Euphorbia lathyris]|uniref:acetylserotonin O-methyltransferase-like n=1 Tax=Euphorbia lathyris TaxID=212925 RepID=UPI0033142364
MKEEEKEEEAQAEVEKWKYIFGFTNMAVVKCAIELGISDAIQNHKSPIPLSDLSSILNCNPSYLHRIMRFLVHQKIFREKPSINGSTGYEQTPLSRKLLGPGENSLKPLFLLESSPVMLAPWHFLSSRVLLNGTGAFEGAHGDDVWKYAEENPGLTTMINEAMASNARLAVRSVIEKCPEIFDGVKSLVDVGGGNGTFVSLLVKAFPWIDGINFDLPHVVSVNPEFEGVTNVGGDMFQNVPNADAASLMWVLHDWNDEECIEILKKCKEAIPKENGKVIIIEAVVGEDKIDDKLEIARLLLDMTIMAHTKTGKERTSKEWGFVIQKAGFSSHSISHISSIQSIIQCFP